MSESPGTEFILAELAIPREVGAEGWGDFLAMTDVRNGVEAGLVGTRELNFEAAELLPLWFDPVDLKRAFVARVDGQIVGRATYEFAADDAIAWVAVEVLEAFRGRGIGSALYDFVLDIALSEGKDVFQTEFYARPDEAGPRIASPSGFGSIAVDGAGARFAIARGYSLEMVLRYSRLPLPVAADILAGHRREAEDAAGDDYRIIRWEGRTPEDWLADRALLRGRMFTDAPHGNLDMGFEVWDADRQRSQDDLDELSPRALLVAAVEHVPSGKLVAFTELLVPQEIDRPVAQRDTLVLADHRGHRLGMLLKMDNLETLMRTHPGHPSVITTNAEENSFMLSVNESVGFVPMAYSGVWKRAAAGATDRRARADRNGD